MAIRSILRTKTVKGFATGATAPIYIDSDDNILKVIPAGSGTTEVQVVDASSTQTLTNKTLTAPAITGATSHTGAETHTGAEQFASLSDSAGVVREIFNPTAKTIVDGSATALFRVAIAAGAVAGGVVDFMIHASDATDHQVIAGILTYSGENKAGTIVGAATYATANEAKSVSAGTLTLAFTQTDDATTMTVLVQPTGSLTETTYTITYTVRPLRGVVTIL
jgi:hypothetical protein